MIFKVKVCQNFYGKELGETDWHMYISFIERRAVSYAHFSGGHSYPESGIKPNSFTCLLKAYLDSKNMQSEFQILQILQPLVVRVQTYTLKRITMGSGCLLPSFKFYANFRSNERQVWVAFFLRKDDENFRKNIFVTCNKSTWNRMKRLFIFFKPDIKQA